MAQRAQDISHLFRERYRTILRYIRQRVDDRELAEDLASEVFTLAWSKHQEGVAISMSWLVTASRNLIGNHYQRRASERAQLKYLIAEELAEEGGGAGDIEKVELRFVMTQLQPRDALALQLTYWDGLTASEAAIVMECSVAAYWTRLTRARRALRKLLSVDAPARPNQSAARTKGASHHG